ncbi:tetratricopeptide repeat protein [Bacteroides nordii]|uniref:tetratricopeptide repeat protein n=1 Tax=Bacteroides nordii TaxID=291645 RepID=UPI0039996C3B
MRNMSLWGVLFLFILILCTCTPKDINVLLPDLAHAEAIMYQYPDSALHILETMEIPVPTDKFQNATWCLLITQAREKNFQKHTSDSLINIAYDYFMKQGDPQRKALVLNYKGVINEEAFDNIEKATQFYLEASKEVEKSVDYQLAFLIYRYLGRVYASRCMSEYAMQAFQKAYRYAKLSKNKSYISNSLNYIAKAYSLRKEWNKAIEYYTQAYELAKTTSDQRTISGIANELSNAYSQTKKYTLAMKYAQEALYIDEKEQLKDEEILLTIGDIYRKIGKIDSANYFFNKAVLSDNIYTCRAAYQGLWYLNRDLAKNDKKALEYADKFWIYTDSIQAIDKSKELIKMQEKFNQQKVLSINSQMQINKNRSISYVLWGMVVLLCLVAVLIYVYQRKLIQQKHIIQKSKEHICNCTKKIHEYESLIASNEDRIKELLIEITDRQRIQEQFKEELMVLADIQQQSKILNQENISLQKSIQQYSSLLKEKEYSLKSAFEEKLWLSEREKKLCNQLIKKSEVINSLKRSPKYLDTIHWVEVCDAVDEIYDDFTKRLSNRLPFLAESDLQFCCLLKIELSIPEIAMILGISATSVSRKKLRLKRRIVEKLEYPLKENQTLDLWVLEY